MEERSGAYQQFVSSMDGGQGFDLAALRACSDEEREGLVAKLAPRAEVDWRHVEALLAIGTPDAVAAARRGLTGSDRLMRLYTAGQLRERGETGFFDDVVGEALANAGPDDGLNVALELAVRYGTPELRQALLDATIDAGRDTAPMLGSALFYALGATHQRDGGPFKPFFWEMATMERGERIEALRGTLTKSPADTSGLDWGDGAPPPAGPVRLAVRWLMRLVSLATLGAMGWHIYALASLPDRAFDAVHAPVQTTVLAGLSAIMLLLWFDGRWRWTPVFLAGALLLALSGLSMRWIDSSHEGLREHWAGLELQRTALAGDLCYRIDDQTFKLRGELPDSYFTYARGWWPTAFDEETFKRYLFSDLPMATGPDGWKCRAGDAALAM